MKATVVFGEGALTVRVALAGSGPVDVVLSEVMGSDGLGVLTVGVGPNPPVLGIVATGAPGKVGVKVLKEEKAEPQKAPKAQKGDAKKRPLTPSLSPKGARGKKHSQAALEGATGRGERAKGKTGAAGKKKHPQTSLGVAQAKARKGRR